MSKMWRPFSGDKGDTKQLYPPVAPRGSRQDLEDQIRGTIYGNCMGDAIGLLTEFMSKKQADMVYYRMYYEEKRLEYEHKLEDGHRSRWKTGDWTDDSDQMILIMDSILDCHGEITPVDFARKLRRWAFQGFQELGDVGGMGIGSTTSHVLRHNKYRTDPHAAAEDIWVKSGRVVAPNGAVMRTSILGIYQYEDLEKVAANSIAMAKVTHADPRCLASCVAVTTAIATMLRRDPKHMNADGSYNIELITDDSYAIARTVFKEDKEGKAWKKEFKNHMYITDIKKLQLDDSNKIGYTLKAMGAGFWALRQDDFRTALQTITMEAGDADTNGAVAGAMLGCKLYNKLPESWLTGLKHKEWLDKRINRFLDHMFGSEHGDPAVSGGVTPAAPPGESAANQAGATPAAPPGESAANQAGATPAAPPGESTANQAVKDQAQAEAKDLNMARV